MKYFTHLRQSNKPGNELHRKVLIRLEANSNRLVDRYTKTHFSPLRKKALPKTAQKKLQAFANRSFNAWLHSKGERLLTLNPEKYKTGLRVGFVASCPFTIGDRKFTKNVQRTFSLGQSTKVPSVIADLFLNGDDVIEVSADA